MYYRVVVRQDRYVVERSIAGRAWLPEGAFRDRRRAVAYMDRLVGGRPRNRQAGWRRRVLDPGGVGARFRRAMMISASCSSTTTMK